MGPKVTKKINQDFFKKWSSDMAYVLGFFVADGCITLSKGRKSNPYMFNITSKDLEHLYNINKALSSDYKIGKKSNSSGSIAYQINVRNSVLSRDLMNLGVYLRKTYNLKPIKTPEKYFSDFVRGFFDGDGSVYIYNVNKVVQIKSSFVCTSLDFIAEFNERLYRVLGIPKKSIHKTLGRKMGFMKQFSNCFYIGDSEKLAKFMYGNNPSLYLERKREIFEKWALLKRRSFTKKNYPSKIGWKLREGIIQKIHRLKVFVMKFWNCPDKNRGFSIKSEQ